MDDRGAVIVLLEPLEAATRVMIGGPMTGLCIDPQAGHGHADLIDPVPNLGTFDPVEVVEVRFPELTRSSDPRSSMWSRSRCSAAAAAAAPAAGTKVCSG